MRSTLVVAAVLLALASAACGGGSGHSVTKPLVPANVHRYVAPTTTKAPNATDPVALASKLGCPAPRLSKGDSLDLGPKPLLSVDCTIAHGPEIFIDTFTRDGIKQMQSPALTKLACSAVKAFGESELDAVYGYDFVATVSDGGQSTATLKAQTAALASALDLPMTSHGC